MSQPPMPPVLHSTTPDSGQTHGEVDVEEWPEQRAAGRRLGTHRDLDRRRYQFAVEATAGWLLPPKSVEWQRFIPILDQGDCGGAAAFAIVGALGSEPQTREEMKQIPIQQPPPLPPTTFFDVRVGQYTVDLAVSIYGQATHLDDVGEPGDHWPATDPGTTVDAVCAVVRQMGLITGWGHCMGVTSVPHALQQYGPVLVTLPWYEGFDEPAPLGAELRIDGQVRGGNTLLCRRYEHGDSEDTSWFWLDGNYGPGFGIEGHVRLSAATLRQLYRSGAHATVLRTGNPRA